MYNNYNKSNSKDITNKGYLCNADIICMVQINSTIQMYGI